MLQISVTFSKQSRRALERESCQDLNIAFFVRPVSSVFSKLLWNWKKKKYNYNDQAQLLQFNAKNKNRFDNVNEIVKKESAITLVSQETSFTHVLIV